MLSTLGKKVKVEWNKSWSERSSLGNLVLAGPKIVSGIISFMINPFPNLRRKINEEINRDAFVQIKNVTIDLSHEGNWCQVISQQELNSSTIKKKSNGDYRFIYKEHEYRLSPIINNAYQKHITNKEGDKLYGVEELKKNAKHTPVLWINKDGKINEKYCGERVKQSISNNIKAIVIVPRSGKTGKVIFPLLPLTFTTGVAAIIIKMVGSVLKNIFDIPGNLLCKTQDRLLHGLDLKYTADKCDAIEYSNENPKSSITTALSQCRYTLGIIFGIIGNSLKLVGTTLNETLRFSSAILSSPSALCSQMSRTVKKEHLIVASKSFCQNIKISGIELLNSATKSVENIDGSFANETEKNRSSMKEQKIKENTVEYGHTKELKQDKSDNNLLKKALLFGKNLLNSGVEIANSSDRAINSLEEFRGINNSSVEKIIS